MNGTTTTAWVRSQLSMSGSTAGDTHLGEDFGPRALGDRCAALEWGDECLESPLFDLGPDAWEPERESTLADSLAEHTQRLDGVEYEHDGVCVAFAQRRQHCVDLVGHHGDQDKVPLHGGVQLVGHGDRCANSCGVDDGAIGAERLEPRSSRNGGDVVSRSGELKCECRANPARTENCDTFWVWLGFVGGGSCWRAHRYSVYR